MNPPMPFVTNWRLVAQIGVFCYHFENSYKSNIGVFSTPSLFSTLSITKAPNQ